MIVKVINKDCYQVEMFGGDFKPMYVRRIFEPELFLAITIAIIEKHGFQQ